MTEIRWEPTGDGGFTGHMGTLEAFRIAPSGEGEKWTWHLTSRLPGQQDDDGWVMDPVVAKVTAETWHGTYLSARPYVAAALAALYDKIKTERDARQEEAILAAQDDDEVLQAVMLNAGADALGWVLSVMDRAEQK